MAGRNMRDLRGKVVAITGGGRGIGLAVAQAFAARGAQVAIGDIDATLAVEAAGPLGGFGGALDVRDAASFARFLKASEQALGPVEVLVNNAGIMPMGAFLDESDAISDAQIAINLRGVITGCKLVLPGMVARRCGHIVNVASGAAFVPIPGAAVYCATKFAVLGLTQSLREEYRDCGVGFTTLMPGKVTTELSSGTDGAARGVPTVSPQQVAAAVVGAVQQGRTEVAVPRYLAAARPALATAPDWLQRGVRRAFGDHRILERLDAKARAAYDARLATLATATRKGTGR
jgi:short-subunit dehydrogenase